METAIADALELTSFVLIFIDTDDEVFPHYFSDQDRAEVTRIFTSINNSDKGNDQLGNMFIQITDLDKSCTTGTKGMTLAYLHDSHTDKPFLVLCPPVFKK